MCIQMNHKELTKTCMMKKNEKPFGLNGVYESISAL